MPRLQVDRSLAEAAIQVGLARLQWRTQDHARAASEAAAALDGPSDDPGEWMRSMWPSAFSRNGQPVAFGGHQLEALRWLFDLRLGKPTHPMIAEWARGGGKSTVTESGVAAVGCRGTRRYALYVSGTQERADDHVLAIGSKLESPQVEARYPLMSQREVGKYGAPRGWRRNRLWTRTGFVVDAIGLDVASRGIKIEDQRPDMIILDDIDARNDSLDATEKKLATLTDSILPAGSWDVAVLGVQNPIIPHGIFSRLAGIGRSPTGETLRADFLADRVVSGPYPALHGVEYEEDENGVMTIVQGTPVWEGQDIDACNRLLHLIGLPAFEREALHNVRLQGGGMWDGYNFIRVNPDEVPPLVRTVVWVDPAVTSTDQSDSQGVCCASLADDGRVYFQYAWEGIEAPLDAIKRAITVAFRYGAYEVGIETDQGGDLWKTEYTTAVQALREEGGWPTDPLTGRPVGAPLFKEAKAGAGYGPKASRWGRLHTDYTNGQIRHVTGTHLVLEDAMGRVPKFKPYDLVDAAFWAWEDLRRPIGGGTTIPAGMMAGAGVKSGWFVGRKKV